MKLVRYSDGEMKRIGVLSEDRSSVIDLSSLAPAQDSMAAFLRGGSANLENASRMISEEVHIPLNKVTLLAPISDPQKILCIGQNYRDHCEEQNQPIPERVILFAKYATAISNPMGDILIPEVSDKIDYEAELAVVIGTPGRNIPEEAAMTHVVGYMCANDVTARDIQKSDGQWTRGKSPDTFFPIGPYIVTTDEVEDPGNLDIILTLNNKVMQSSNTSNLIFKIPYLISYLSQTMTLMPGDILSTGTPGGVGVYRNPPVFLKSGDEVEVTIPGVGSLKNGVA